MWLIREYQPCVVDIVGKIIIFTAYINRAMNIYGIITGDIVGSTKLNKEDRDHLNEVLKKTIDEISSMEGEDRALEFEMFRGDSFQIKVTNAKESLRVALLIRLGLISARDDFQAATSRKSSTWDARLSIGIGTIDYVKKTINISDGEAFRYSGKAFDSLNRTNRLIIRTSNEKINEEFEIECFMSDVIIRRFSDKQAKITYRYLLEEGTQKSIAQKMGVTPQAVNKSLQHGGNALHAFIERFKMLIERL